MNAETAGHAGTPQLKQFHMVNTKMVFYHPKKYKELHGLTSRKCNTRQRAQGSLPANGALNSDQTISDSQATADDSVRSGPGHKPQATSAKLQAPSASSHKLQASSPVAKASSFKPQASSAKIPEPGNK